MINKQMLQICDGVHYVELAVTILISMKDYICVPTQ